LNRKGPIQGANLAAAAGLDTSGRLGAHLLRHAFAEAMLVHRSNARAV
jgi:site-specific recombinase XerD